MVAALPVIVVVFDLLLPIALLLWVLKTRAQSRIYFASIVLSAAMVIVILTQAIFGFWYVVGVFWPTVYVVGLAVILIVRARRGLPASWLPHKFGWEAVLTTVNVLHAGLWALLIPPLMAAGSYEGTALRLSSPLRGGEFYVLAGGANTTVNQHSDYALDIVKLNAFGLSASGFFPQDLTKYPAFGVEVIAPCAGEVIAAENTRPNRPVLDPDSEDRGGGNHVVIFCDGHSVHLAHLQPGTVAVNVGAQVTAGQPVGRVGNSGNTTQPHLHINAARGRYLFVRSDDRALNAAESVPFLIDDRFLVKGDSFTN